MSRLILSQSWVRLLIWLYAASILGISSSASLAVDAIDSNGTTMTTMMKCRQRRHGLRSPSAWTNRPVYIQADEEGTSTRILHGNDSTRIEADDGSLPLGVPIPFESDLFKGQILFRIKNVASTSSSSSDNANYFEGRRRLWQFIVQGRFKTPIGMEKLYTGEVYEKPLANLPAPMIMRMVGNFFNLVVPGIQFDIASKDNPKILALYGGTVQTLRKDLPGTEPDIRLYDIDEDTRLLRPKSLFPATKDSSSSSKGAFHSVVARKKALSNLKRAANYEYDTEHVYTFDQYDHLVDYGTYVANFGPGVQIDIMESLNGQPLTISAITDDGRWMFRFKVFHERQLQQQPSP